MIVIKDNFHIFKKGVLDACKLFKVIYENNRNILLYKDDELYINNIEQLCDSSLSNSTAYSFGYNFILENVRNLRQNICINPILYILCIETVIKNCTSIEDFNKYKDLGSRIVFFLKQYYLNSNLKNAMITLSDVKNLFNEEDSFLNRIIEIAYKPANIQIIESKENKIVSDSYYRIKGNLICGDLFKQECKIFITNHVTVDLYNKLNKLRIPILLICSTCDVELEHSYFITIIKVSITTFMKHYDSICILTGAGRGYYNLDENEFNSYSFGHIKEFKFIEGELLFSVENYLLANDNRLERYNNKDSRNIYYMLQGKNFLIYVQEEYMEKVRNITSLVKSLILEGIFYDEIKTLKILLYFFKNDEKFISQLLSSFLSINNIDTITIQKVIYDDNLRHTFDVKTKAFVSSNKFNALDYYLNIFQLLNSNINILSKVN